MTIYFLGSEIPGFAPSDSVALEQAHADPFGRARTGVYTPASYIIVPDLPDLNDLWVHGFAQVHGMPSAPMVLTFVNAAGTPTLRIQASTLTSTWTVQSFEGGAWAAIGSPITLSVVHPQEFDVHLDASASGSLTLYIAGTERFSHAGNLSFHANVAELRMSATSGVQSAYWGFAVADEPTIGWRVATYYPSGPGASAQWTNGHTTIDELAHDDADFIASDTASDVSTFAAAGPALTGYSVRAVGVAARAKRGGSGPASLQLVLRAGASDYFSASQALGLGYETRVNVWETNPATSSAFLTAEIAALQPGVKSIA